MEEIPTMKATIEDTSLYVVGWKDDWNGQEEESIPFSDLMKEEIPVFPSSKGIYGYDKEICFSFGDAIPSDIQVNDVLLSEDGRALYTTKEKLDREVRVGEDGNYYIGLTIHFAQLLSSNSATYENPSNRGFEVTCKFGEEQVCVYKFVLSLEPIWKVIN